MFHILGFSGTERSAVVTSTRHHSFTPDSEGLRGSAPASEDRNSSGAARLAGVRPTLAQGLAGSLTKRELPGR